MNKKSRTPLLFLAFLVMLFSTAEIVSTPMSVSAGTKVENPGEDMDGDPENYSGDSPRVISGTKAPETPEYSDEVLFTRLLRHIGTWFWATFLRISNGI
jgi:hypothetical protein